ncbi:endonuclease/exonuclease/phosphatase family protein [Desulfocurvibacter africanus]|uniref:endonuclease/exonuclease/phosphatase family protein n=1 Tax=Desulfocurvibacter africanus TaxID=873 RepID=UPI00040C3979|nr:endonuclease/exonuclease/phosphatase family protein [Desulfocurvibacter africanus]
MSGIWKWLIQGSAVFYVASAILPLLKSDAWWIRGWDFPRLQFAIFGLATMLLLSFTTPGWPLHKLALVLFLAVSLALDAYRIVPYTPLVRLESLPADRDDPARKLSIIVANVLQDNDDPQPLLRLLAELSPDMVLLLEVNGRWMDELSDLRSSYPHHVGQSLENTYGIALFSRLELIDARVRYLVEPDVPSIHGLASLVSGEVVEIHGLHPKPPKPQSGGTTERDAELVLIAREARDSEHPVIVMGDLNDVAWSHTTRLFRRISEMLDPRVGRGHFPTYPVALPFLRYPLDHVFHSRSLRLVEFKRLPDIGSDHFPVYAEFSLEPEGRLSQESPKADEQDHEEARDTLRRAE